VLTYTFQPGPPLMSSNPIGNGIENLFSRESIERARTANVKFIDVTPELKRLVRGTEEIVPEKFEVNRQEKKNLCDWFCENGTVDDFRGLKVVFDLIEGALKEQSQGDLASIRSR